MFAQVKKIAVALVVLGSSFSASAYGLRCEYDFRGSTMRIDAIEIVRESGTSGEYRRGEDNSPKKWKQIVVRHSNLVNDAAKATNFSVSVLPEKGTDLDGNPANTVLTYAPNTTYVNAWKSFEIKNNDEKNGRVIKVDVERRLVSIYKLEKSDSGGTGAVVKEDIPATCKTGGTAF